MSQAPRLPEIREACDKSGGLGERRYELGHCFSSFEWDYFMFFLFSQVNKYVKYSKYTYINVHMNTYEIGGQPAPWHDFISFVLVRIVVVYFDSCHRPAWDVAFNACRNTLTFTFMFMFLPHAHPSLARPAASCNISIKDDIWYVA